MVDKEYSEQLRIKPRVNEMTFTEHHRGLKAEYDQVLLETYLPVTSGVNRGDRALADSLGAVIPEGIRTALRETQFIGVYGRILKSSEIPDLICLQYLYVWDYQAVPAHEGDYEPIFVFLDKRRKYAIYDLVHYCSRRLDFELPLGGNLGLRMIPGWHSFIPALISESSRDKNLEVKPLSDQHLRSWWSIPDESVRLKIVNRFRDPFLLEAPGHFQDSPDENSITMCCTFLEIEKALAEFDDPKQAVVEGVKRAFAKCVGLFALYRLNAFIQLLGEMNDIGMLKVPITSTGLNLTAISNLLKDGIISVTKAGHDFFSGFYAKEQTDDED
ncbi:MAG: hypothetical protein ACFFCT_03230 [Candidatus Odinarchaeota archaeon]